MQFDVDGLALQFKDLVNFTLADKYGPEIKGYIRSYKKRWDEFLTVADPKDAYKELIKTKLTNGLYRQISDKRKPYFDADFDSFFDTNQKNPGTLEATNKLTNIIINYSSFPPNQLKAKDWVNKLFRYKNLKHFTQNLYILRKNGQQSEILGDKGADHYLRGIGYFDIIPIDIHERRFLIRTGIWHLFNIKNQDPIDLRSLQDALSQFCLHRLKGNQMEGLDLGTSPGIVDLLIWSYCSDQGYNICGKVPKCRGCKLEGICFLGVANSTRVIDKQRTNIHGAKESEDMQISKLPLSSTSITADDQLRKIKAIKLHLAKDYITDSEEMSLFLRTRDNNIHEWGPYIAGVNLSKTKTTFRRSEINNELYRLIPEIYNQMYVKISMIIPSDVIDKPWETGRDYAHGKDYAHEFPCLEQTGRNQYQFVGFKEGIRKRYGNNALKKRLSES